MGKSRFIRGLVNEDKLNYLPFGFCENINKAGMELKLFLLALQETYPDSSNEDLNLQEIIRNLDEAEIDLTPLSRKYSSGITTLKNLLETIDNETMKSDLSHRLQRFVVEYEKVKNLVNASGNAEFKRASEMLRDAHRFYIPVLRGLRPVVQGSDVYYNRTVLDYFSTQPKKNDGTKLMVNDKIHIETGFEYFNRLQELLLGGEEDRMAIEEFQKFLSVSFYNSEDVLLLPKKAPKNDVIHVKIGTNPSRAIYDLGDGVQQIIIMTLPLFIYKNLHPNTPHLVFIEEPELYLHPGMQRILLKAFNRFENYQFFLTTHSNHLLDLTIEDEFSDISIYLINRTSNKPVEQFNIVPLQTHDHHALQTLGVRASSVFLSNCTIWVEGIYDRRYLAYYLELLKNSLNKVSKPFLPKQDLHYSFVEYSGGNITHWSFLREVDDPIEFERISSKIMLISDRDDLADAAKIERHRNLEERLGKERFHRLECREIENLLTPDVLLGILESKGEEVSELSFKQEDYKIGYLGDFLESTVPNHKRKYRDSSGTIYDKKGFCARAIEVMKNKNIEFTDLSIEAQELTTKIYEFIKISNLGSLWNALNPAMRKVPDNTVQ